MILKRLIAISVVFALVAGTAFAVDLGGAVIGTVNFLEGSSAKDANENSYPVEASAGMQRVRVEGSGENDDGTFGGWLRIDGVHWSGNPQFEGFAWWKPIDMLKLGIGGNSDGMYAKEGVTAWMFYQTASDTGVVDPANAWGGGYGPVEFRQAFYGGFDKQALHLTVSPADIVDINIAVPFFIGGDADYDPDTNPGGSASYIFQRTHAQVDLKLDFGNIALTYVGNGNKYADDNPGKIFAYFGLTSIENLGIDVGLGFPLPLVDKEFAGVDGKEHKATKVTPIAAGLGVKFTADSFGIKARVVASFAGSSKVDYDGDAGKPDPEPLLLTADILPFFAMNDNLRIFFSAGLGITGVDKNANGDKAKDANGDDLKATVAWHINPYVEIGQEWGPKFLAGLRIWSDGVKSGDDKALVNWGIPLALHVGF